MPQIYDLTAESLKRICKLVPDESLKIAAQSALASPSRRCRTAGAACVHRLSITDEQRVSILKKLRTMLARGGFEENGQMLPIGHVYEGLIATFSKPHNCLA